MKKADVTKILRSLGWWDTGKGKKHEKWTNGELVNMVPRHREINEDTAKSIIKLARANSAEGAK
jgi:hypothetical protein